MIIAKYTCNDSGILPSFNTGYTNYTTNEINNADGTYTTEIAIDDVNNLPTKISFSGNSQLLSVEILNISKVTDMSNMFFKCSSLTELNIDEWNTVNVTNMSNMFFGCSSLTELNISKWNTSKVTNISGMFHSCKSLTELNVNNWDTSNVTNMSSTFISCSGLTDLDLSNWNTNKVTLMYDMFSGCHKLLSLNISNFNINNANTNTMLNNCWVLRKVNLSNSSPATVSTIVSLLPNRSAVDNAYIFARVEVPNQKYWETILCKDSSVTVSLPQPLNKIGNMKDKLYWDEDKGHYCIEQKIGTIHLSNYSWWSIEGNATEDYDTFILSSFNSGPVYFPTIWGGKIIASDEGEYTLDDVHLRVKYPKNKFNGDLESFKSYCKNNNIWCMLQSYVGYITKPIDLPHLNKKYSLDTYMPTTYLECSNSPIQPSRMYFETDKLKYKPLALETNKDYTIQFNCEKVSEEKVKFNLGGSEEEIQAVVGTNHINITTPAELSSDRLYISGQGNKVSDVMLIEGNMKQYPNYFDGVQSVGVLQDDNTYKIDIKTNEDFIVSIKTDLPLTKEDRLYWNDTNKRYEIDRSGEIEVPTVEGDIIDLPRLYQRDDTILTVDTGNIKPSEIKIKYKDLN